MSAKSFRLEIFLVSLSAILLEIAYTRIFSYKLHYYFVFLTIGIALLGLGSGGVFVTALPRLRAVPPGRLVARACLGAATLVPVGYWIIAATQLDAVRIAEDPIEFLTLVWLGLMLFLPFLLVGIVLATIFASRPEEIDRLYFADLAGAALGCALCVPLFATISPPGAVLLAGALFALAAARPPGPARPALALCLLLAAGALFADRLPDPVPDSVKTNSPQRMNAMKILFSRWSTVFRVDVLDGLDPTQRLLVSHDGNLGSNVLRFDGNFDSLKRLDADVRSTPFSVIPPDPEILIIGAAGGHEILASLYFGAGHVTAVELNPVTVSLLTDHFAEYSGHIAENPRVTLVNAEGRSFVERDRGRYDLVWFVAPDSYAAMNAASSGAFVLSESYLYTEAMIRQAFAHLKPGGVLCLQTGDVDFARKPNRAARYLSTARSALRSLGIEDFARHALVSSTPEFFTMVTILLSEQPFTPAQVESFRANAKLVKPVGRESTVWHPRLPGQEPVHPVQQMVSLSDADLESWRGSYPYDLSPVTDDSPFFWHFTSFRDAIFEPGDAKDSIYDPEDAKGERVLVALLVFASLFAAVFLLLPLATIGDVWKRIPYKRNALVYFASLGLGFMFFEISLIQKLTLFLGYPSYSLMVTLFALLIFSGLGSLLSRRWVPQRSRALAVLLGVLLLLTVFYQFGVAIVVGAVGGAALPFRIAVAVVLLAPLGLCLGAFMPLGLGAVASLTPHRQEYVAWAWAVNGFFSVVSSVLATMLSMAFGFRVVLLLALAVYALGVLALRRIPEAASAEA